MNSSIKEINFEENKILLPSNQTRVSCDGGGSPLGHPKIWLELLRVDEFSKSVICPYCSRKFISND